jgi:hypothetical protein
MSPGTRDSNEQKVSERERDNAIARARVSTRECESESENARVRERERSLNNAVPRARDEVRGRDLRPQRDSDTRGEVLLLLKLCTM